MFPFMFEHVYADHVCAVPLSVSHVYDIFFLNRTNIRFEMLNRIAIRFGGIFCCSCCFLLICVVDRRVFELWPFLFTFQPN